jgi:hypothetical protein
MAPLAGGDSPPLPPPEPSKGKAKMDGEAEVEGAGKMCGICYVDGGRAIRGEIDCCAHYFCFVCIMAWGRVESRCPFCKARFRTIRCPPVPGRFPDERIVSVPERNQVIVWYPKSNLIRSNPVIPLVFGISVVEILLSVTANSGKFAIGYSVPRAIPLPYQFAMPGRHEFSAGRH